MRLVSLLIAFCMMCMMFSSCSYPCHDYAVMGADEFVIDSYRIREGKLAILEFQGKAVEELPEEALDQYCDVVDEDDILTIVVYHPSRKDLMQAIQFVNDNVGGFRVHEGKVDIPDIPPVEVIGLSLDDAREKIQRAFRDQIQDVEVFVTYKDRLSRKVELTGMVTTSTIPVDGKIRLYEIIAKAHVPSNANLFMSYVLRDGQPLAIDFHQLINEGDMCQNIVMRGGDKIFIANPADSTVMLMGEVLAPRRQSPLWLYVATRSPCPGRRHSLHRGSPPHPGHSRQSPMSQNLCIIVGAHHPFA